MTLKWNSDLRPTNFNLQPATCNLQPATSNVQPATCDINTATCKVRPLDKLRQVVKSEQEAKYLYDRGKMLFFSSDVFEAWFPFHRSGASYSKHGLR